MFPAFFTLKSVYHWLLLSWVNVEGKKPEKECQVRDMEIVIHKLQYLSDRIKTSVNNYKM